MGLSALRACVPPLPWEELRPHHSFSPPDLRTALSVPALTPLPQHRNPRNPRAIAVAPGDMWTLAGTKGSGKTFAEKQLARELLRLFPDMGVNVLDPKPDEGFDTWPGLVGSDEAPEPAAPGQVVVWRPGYDNLTEYDRWFESILKGKRRALVVIDELSSVCDKQGRTVQNLQRLMKQNRSLGITLEIGTQETHWIPRQTLGLAVHILRFALLHPRDANAIDHDYLGLTDRREPIQKHGFLYCNVSANPRHVFEYSSIRELLRSA